MLKRLLFVLALGIGTTSLATAQYTTAEDVLEANLEATGGRAAWEAIENMHVVQEVLAEMPQGLMTLESEAWIIFPDYMFADVRQTMEASGMPAVDSKIYMTPEGGWMETPQGRQEFDEPPAELRNAARSDAKEELALLNGDAELTLLPNQKMDGTDTYVVQVGGENGTKRYYDAESLLLIATEAPSPMGGTMIQRVSDYRQVGNVQFPHQQDAEITDEIRQSVVLSTVEFNIDLTPEQLKTKAEQ